MVMPRPKVQIHETEIIHAYSETGELVEGIKMRFGISGDDLYPLLKDRGVTLRMGLKVRRKDPKLPTQPAKKPFGVIIRHSTSDLNVGDQFEEGSNNVIIHKAVVRKPTPEKCGFFEYKVSYGQGMREV